MTGLVFSSVVLAALLHASWNALVKTGHNKQSGMLLLTLAHAFFGLCLLPFVSVPQGAAWLWLIASGLIHMFYQLFLGFAYERGDLSRVYPIARGAAPMIVLIVSLSFGIDPLRGLDLLGILVLGLGIVLMAHGVLQLGRRSQAHSAGTWVSGRHGGLFTGGWAGRAGDGRCAGLCLVVADFLCRVLHACNCGAARSFGSSAGVWANCARALRGVCFLYCLCTCGLGHDGSAHCPGHRLA